MVSGAWLISRRESSGEAACFEPLEDPAFFRQVHINNELGTIVWPNEVDFCPDLLHRWATGEPVLRPEAEVTWCLRKRSTVMTPREKLLQHW